MRITNVCINGPVTDGFHYQDNMLTKYQRRLGHEVTIITSKWVWNEHNNMVRDERDDYVNEHDVRVIRLEMKGRDDFRRKFKVFAGLYEAIDSTKPDFIFLHNVSCRDDRTVARYLRKHPNVAAVADNHGDFSNTATNWISKNILHGIIWKHYVKLLIPYVKKFYGVLPARVDFLCDIYRVPRSKCELLVMGADDDLLEKYAGGDTRKRLREKIGIKEDDFLIVTGGKIDKWKYQTLYLMDAINSIENKSVKLLIFGPVAEDLKKQFEKRLSNKIIYEKWADPDKSYQFFSIADLAVFPGRHSVYWEEAVGIGIPLVVKDWTGTHHIDVGGNVKYIIEDSAHSIKSILEQLINDNNKSYLKMQSAAFSEYRKKFLYSMIAIKSIEVEMS